MTIDQIKVDMSWLTGRMQNRLSKYRRNFNRYCNNGRRAEDIREQYGNPLSYQSVEAGEDTGITPNLNVIKSAIDTHISKLSQTKVRPFFNPLLGTFKTRKVCRNAQIYFDEFFEMQDVYKKAIEAARHADIWEYGALWIDDEDREIKKVMPWEFYVDPAEYNFGKISRCILLQKQFPLIALKEKLKAGTTARSLLDDKPTIKVERAIYWDLLDKKRHTFVNAELIDSRKIEYECVPFALIYLEHPMKGVYSVSMADDLYSIQQQVDTLCERIHLALELSPANTVWVPEGSKVKGSILSNEIGAIYEYRPFPGMTSGGVSIATPPPIDPEYMKHLEFWVRQAYEIKGISQLSAQAKKPSGLQSGVALQTVEDVESERHNIVLQHYVRFLMEIAETCINVFPAGLEVLPRKSGRARISWSDIKQERDSFSIQFSASSSLSKDPKVKMEQVEKLIQMGIINESLASTLLEFPDLENAYSIRSSSYDYCQRIIERAVEEDLYDYFEIVDIQQLFGEICNTLLRLDANDEDPKVLKRLVKLLLLVKAKIDVINQSMMLPVSPEPAVAPEPLQPPATPGGPGAIPEVPAPLPPQPVAPQIINLNIPTAKKKVTIKRGPQGELLGADIEEGIEETPVIPPEVPVGP